MMSTRPGETVAKSPHTVRKIQSLGLQPWQNPPMYARFPDLEKPFDDPLGERDAAEILRELLAKLSMYEPIRCARWARPSSGRGRNDPSDRTVGRFRGRQADPAMRRIR
jgi:hypothetical protein